MFAIDLFLKCSPILALVALTAVVASSWRTYRLPSRCTAARSAGNRQPESATSEFAASVLMLCVCLLTFCGGAYFFSRENVRANDDQWLDRLADRAAKPEALPASLKPERKIARNQSDVDASQVAPASEQSECSPPDEIENAADAPAHAEVPCEFPAQL